MTVHHTFCRICESLCGLEVTVEDGQITKISPDRDHVATRGFACIKGVRQEKLYSSPDRLKHPLKRVGDDYVEISWDEALHDIGTAVRRVVRDHGGDAVGMYVGTAAGFSALHPIFASAFMDGIGSSSLYASATQDCANKFAVADRMYGFPFTQPFPDIHHTECLIITGANPVMSKWSFLQVPNPYVHLHEMQKRGAKVIVVDPRVTETAKAASEHLFIRPNTDVFFFLAFLHELFAIGGVDRDRVGRFVKGIDAVEALVRPWTPERAEVVTKLPAAALRRMVRTFSEADGAAMYASTGVNMGTQGSLSFWLQECINALSGNLDRRGGTLVGQGVFDFPKFGVKNKLLTKPGRSRIGNFRRTNDAFPGGVLADEILTEGPGQLRALFVTGGNPLLTMPNSARLRDAFRKLELLVTIDIFLNETGSVATHVLPSTSPFQRPDLPFIFPLFLGLQSKPYLQATNAVLEPQGEQRDEATIYLDLARACGAGLFGSKAVNAALQTARRVHEWRGGRGVPQRMLLDGLLRVTGQGSFKDLLGHVHGRARDSNVPGSFLGKRVYTEDGKIDLAPPDLLAQAEVLERAYAHEQTLTDRLKLITKRQLNTHNSWTHNHESMVKGKQHTNRLYMHPDDATARGLQDGDMVDVSTHVATVRLPMELLEDLMPGTVAMPHGWGHQHAKGLSVASATSGVNVNLLAADGPDSLEPVSGMAHLTGFVVDVVKSTAPQDPTSWSGIGNR